MKQVRISILVFDWPCNIIVIVTLTGIKDFVVIVVSFSVKNVKSVMWVTTEVIYVVSMVSLAPLFFRKLFNFIVCYGLQND